MTKVKMDVMRPWIANRVTELLGFEDEVLINFIYGLLDGKVIYDLLMDSSINFGKKKCKLQILSNYVFLLLCSFVLMLLNISSFR